MRRNGTPSAHICVRVQDKARANRGEVFTSLAHYLSEESLTRAYRGLKAMAAAGPDGQTKASYGRGLKTHISALRGRLKDGSYRATPAKRIEIDKPDGGGNPTKHLRGGLRRLQLWISPWQESTPMPAGAADGVTERTGELGT
jgi:hypothetical protein